MTEVNMIHNRSKIFLGGTCPGSKSDFDYRPILQNIIDNNDQIFIDTFNPVVEDWTPECIEIEENEKVKCGTHLYVITPNMKGVYSIAECFGSLIKNNNKRVILCVIKDISEYNLKFEPFQIKSLQATGDLLNDCGGEFYAFEHLYQFKQDILNILVED